jgi:hypothetical protein
LVRDIPYVSSARRVGRGILVIALDLAGDRTAAPTDHTAMFCGDMPCHADGTPMDEIKHQSIATEIAKVLVAHHGFSRKPPRGHYVDYFEKVQTYVSLIAREAAAIDPLASALTAQVVEPDEEGYPFSYLDTASARAEINAISSKLANEKVAIIGLGGTGSYVLDLVAKTSVKEIHLFDADKFLTHNAFRAPGAPSVEELRGQSRKAAYFEGQYTKMKRGIKAHEEDIDASNVDVLRAVTFAFVCIDRGPDKKIIIDKLEEFGLPFIDTGMGIQRQGDSLRGQLRVTTSLPERRGASREHISVSSGEPEDEYDKNIQVADLNALNACLAVIKWKKLRGFYLDDEHEQLTTYTIAFNQLTSGDAP